MSAPDCAWVALSLVNNLGGRTLAALLVHFQYDLDAILSAPAAELRKVPGVGPKIAAAIRSIDLDATRRALDRWQQAGVTVLTRDDAAYPPALRRLDDAPPTLFVRGTLPRQPGVAIVGTRRPSPQALELAGRLAGSLVRQGHMIVSGLAAGIDRIAHLEAVAQDGLTTAVLGGGVLSVYPPEHHSLAEAIVLRGALLGEVAPDAPVSVPGLVARNRIIAGLCEHVIVVETGIDGGAMHAARFARAQERFLYTFDLPASGNQALIAAGACVIAPEASQLPPDGGSSR